MDLQASAEEIADLLKRGMISERQLQEKLKKLEELHKQPIQLKLRVMLETPRSSDSPLNNYKELIFGDFEDRPVTVIKYNEADKRYNRDISLIEGNYPSFTALRNKVKDLNVFAQRNPSEGTFAREVQEKVISRFNFKYSNILHDSLYNPDDEIKNPIGNISRLDVMKFFDSNRINAFVYNLEARYSGIVDIVHVSGGSTSCEDLELAANLEFKRL